MFVFTDLQRRSGRANQTTFAAKRFRWNTIQRDVPITKKVPINKNK